MAKQEPAKTTAAPSAATPTTAAAKARKARKPVDPNETPDVRFKRLGQKRLTTAVKVIKGIAQLGKVRASKDAQGNWKRSEKTGLTSGYAFSDAQAAKILETLNDAVAEVKRAFAPRTAGAKSQEVIEL